MHYSNKTKDKNNIIISIEAEKAFDKIKHPFMKKKCFKFGTEGTYLNIIKAIFDTHSQHNTQKQKVESLPIKFRNKSRMTTLMTSFQHIPGGPSHSNQTRKRNKRYLNRKRRGKTITSCRGHDTLYRES